MLLCNTPHHLRSSLCKATRNSRVVHFGLGSRMFESLGLKMPAHSAVLEWHTVGAIKRVVWQRYVAMATKEWKESNRG